MSTEKFPSNSHRVTNQSQGQNNLPPAEAEEPKFERVITGRVIKRKKPLGRRFLDTFFSGDSGVINYLAKEVLVPAFQNLLIDFVNEGIARAVHGDKPRSSYRGYHHRPGGSISRQHISYDRTTPMSRGPVGPPMRRPLAHPSSQDLDEIILDTDFAAKMVAEKMYEAIQDYGVVTVANLKELLGESPQYTDNKWGWGEDAEFQVRRIREGYLLVLPPPVDIK